MEKQNQEKKKSKSRGVYITIIAITGIALILSMFSNVFLWNTSNQNSQLALSKVDSLMYFYNLRDSLTSQINEEEIKIENMVDMLNNNNDSFNEVITKKQMEIASLKMMLRKGGNNSDLLVLKESISRLTAINTALRKRIEEVQNENSEYKNKLAVQQSQINELSTQKNNLQNKVENVSVEIKVGGLTVVPNGIKKGINTPVYKAKEVDFLDLSFDVYENKLFNKKIDKEYIIRIIDPDGIVLSNNNNQLTNSEDVFTAKESVRFLGKAQKVQLTFEQASKYKKGKYNVELKESNKIVQKTNFNLI